MKDIWKITLCLAATCFFAALILGGVFYFTEPAKKINMTAREMAAVRQLLELGDKEEVMEVRRYLGKGESEIGYLLADRLEIYDTLRNPLRNFSKPDALKGVLGEGCDAWVKEVFTGSRYVGRFFLGIDASGKVAGFVTESSRYGFKSSIRFFVALTPAFEVRGVEVISHEEDPGLGAEIIKPAFKEQFAGLGLKDWATLKFLKGPKPLEIEPSTEKKIYAVTGATISSKALLDGVQQAIHQLVKRMQIVFPKGELR